MRRGVLLAAMTLWLVAPASAQVPSAASWSTLESTHFRVTYTRGLEPLARHAAAAAERARAALLDYVGRAPDGRIDIMLSDNIDVSSGTATPFPSNRIHIYARPPVEVAELNYVHDWIELVVAHELAHSFHLDATSGFGRALRTLFGRVPLSWPLFPAVGTPRWSIEGLAVVVESALTPLGRVHGTWHDMVARTAALEGGIEDIDRLNSESPLWPGGQRVYAYGALFYEYLESRYGGETVREIVRSTANATIPPALWFDRVSGRALGASFRSLHEAWRAAATAEAHARADTLRAEGLTATRTLAARGGIAAHPRFSPDGRTLAYISHDRRSAPAVRVIDAMDGRERRSRRMSGDAAAAWLGDGSLLVPMLEFRDPEHIFYDLHRLGANPSRLTRGARLRDVDVRRADDRVVAVRYQAGTNQLVLLGADGRGLRPVTPLDRDVHWSGPRWAPDGATIAAARWSTGGRYDVVLLDTLGTVLREVTRGVGINASPAWSPDGRFLLFASDRTGISNLYAYALEDGTLRQVTNVLTGAFTPDVAPDGRTIAFSVYHADGYHVELLPFDPARWREPQPARLPQLPLPPPPRARQHADTLSGEPRPYRAWPTVRPYFWAPLWVSDGAGDFIGASSFGQDLVGRHRWNAGVALDPGDGRTTGGLGYAFHGLPAVGPAKPVLSFAAARDWERLLVAATPGAPYVDEREDVVSASAGLQRVDWRYFAGLGLAGESVRRRRLLHDAPGQRLVDPEDQLLGVRATASFGSARTHAFSISAEDGVRLQLSARQRWDRNRGSFTDTAGVQHPLDASYRELSGWSAVYRALGRTAFANSVFALRGSALWRSGPGASTHGVGGSSGSGVPGLDFLDAGSQFLPVRGFDAGTRRGTGAWSATAELRLPLLQVADRPRPLPLFLHSLAGALFLDAGNASCPDDLACGPRARGPALVAAGAELGLDVALFGVRTNLRGGAGVPLQGGDRPRAYLQLGPAF